MVLQGFGPVPARRHRNGGHGTAVMAWGPLGRSLRPCRRRAGPEEVAIFSGRHDPSAIPNSWAKSSTFAMEIFDKKTR